MMLYYQRRLVVDKTAPFFFKCIELIFIGFTSAVILRDLVANRAVAHLASNYIDTDLIASSCIKFIFQKMCTESSDACYYDLLNLKGM